jgi:hypothetical protein
LHIREYFRCKKAINNSYDENILISKKISEKYINKDQPCVEVEPKALLKLNVFFPSLPCLELGGIMIAILPSSTLLTTLF